MYESTKNQIKYERKAGLESDFANAYEAIPPPEQVDGWLTPITWEESKKADVWVFHSKFPDELKPLSKEKVTVAILHGPTEHMVLKEWSKQGGDLNLHINLLWGLDATVCINQHEYDVMKHYDEKGNRLYYIPNSIDLDDYKKITPWEYQHHPAILSCDTPRIEKLPLHIVWAMPYVRELIPEARLNLFSLLLEPIQQWRSVLVRSHKRVLEASCENIQLANNNLKPFQAGADIGFNNNYSGIASRVTMEMMACGIPVVSYGGEYTKYHAKIFDLHSIAEQIALCWHDLNKKGSTLKKDTLKYAKENFHRETHIPKYIQLYEKLLGAKK